jgi:hypothetical protein
VRATRGVLAVHGVRGLWRGFPATAFGGLPSQGAYFVGYTWAASALHRWNDARPDGAVRLPLVAVDAAAGMFADVVAAPLWTPWEVLTTRLQIQGPGVVPYASTADAARHIVATEGVRGLFRGMSITLAAYGPVSAAWWAMYQSTHRALTARAAAAGDGAGKLQGAASGSGGSGGGGGGSGGGGDGAVRAARPVVWIDGVSGLVAGSITAVLSNPVDIIKTRVQAQHALLEDFSLDGGRGARAPAAAAVASVASAAVAAGPSGPGPAAAALGRLASGVAAAGAADGGTGGAGAAARPPRRPPASVPRLIRQVVEADGARALIRGALPRIVVQGPASALSLVAYEQVKWLARKDGGGAAGDGSSMARG